MRELTDVSEVSIESAILHKVSPHEPGLELSSRDIPLDQTRQFSVFLAGHVINGLNDSQTRTAHFLMQTHIGVAKLCEDLVLQPTRLVTASQRIAKALQGAMGNDERIAPGALVVAVCKGLTTTPFLALMKLDPGEVFRPEWRTDPQTSKRYLSPREMRNALPTVNQRLQKCAFVNPKPSPGDRERLLILDRQAHGMPANFFTEGFLQAEPMYDPATLTRAFYIAVQTARNKLAETLSPEQVTRLDDAITGVTSGESVDVNEWLKNLPREQRTEIRSQLEDRQIDPYITFDPEVLERLHRKERYEADNGVVIQFDRQAVGTTVKVQSRDKEGYRIVIDTDKWSRRSAP